MADTPTGARSAATSAASSWSAGSPTPPARAPGFGALLLGVHEASGSITYVGRVGTGFSEARLDDLRRRLRALERSASPFASSPPDVPPTAHWVKPELVAEVTFTNWTRDGRLRHPVFVGLREDKPATEVVRERPRAVPAPRRSRGDDRAGRRSSHASRPGALARGRRHEARAGALLHRHRRLDPSPCRRDARSPWCAGRAVMRARPSSRSISPPGCRRRSAASAWRTRRARRTIW